MLAQHILAVMIRNHRLVPMPLLRHFCGVAVSVSLGYAFSRFYTRSLFFDMSRAERSAREGRAQSPERGGGVERRSCAQEGCVRLCRQSIRDLQHWRGLTRGEGRELQHPPPHLTTHSDAADVGWGGGYAWIRYGSREAGFVGRSWFLDIARPRAVENSPRTARSPSFSLSLIRSVRLRTQSAHSASASGESGGGGGAQRHGQCVQAHDFGASSHQADVEALRCEIGRQMDPVRSEALRRRDISYVGSGRSSGIVSLVAGNSSPISIQRASVLPSSTLRGISSTP